MYLEKRASQAKAEGETRYCYFGGYFFKALKAVGETLAV